MKFALTVKTSVKILATLILLSLAATIVLTIFRLAGILGFFSVSLAVDIASLAVSVFLTVVCIIAISTTGYTLDERGVTFRLLFIKIFTPLENVTAFEYSVKLKLACVYHAVEQDGKEGVGQMIVNIRPDKYADFARELKRLKPMAAILPVDEMSDD